MAAASGRLELISTPIGNIGDLAPRAREVLALADLVLAEDTRHSGALLANLGLAKPLLSLHEHNEGARLPELLAKLRSGAVLALISDAGTPLISDPGYLLVAACVAAGIEVRCVPGPSAVTAALSVSGLPAHRYSFEGFLPAQAPARQRVLQELCVERRTLIFFEAPHRIKASLADCTRIFGATRPAAVARELTKLHERVYRGTLAELCAAADADEHFERGEITLLVAGVERAADAGDEQLLRRALTLLVKELPPGKAAALAARLSGVARERAYALALELGRRGAAAT